MKKLIPHLVTLILTYLAFVFISQSWTFSNFTSVDRLFILLFCLIIQIIPLMYDVESND